MRKRVIISGKVQGVFFRDFCRRKAIELQITGWVRNNSDGTVEAVFEGEPQDVEKIVLWCHKGPPRAVVTKVDVVYETQENSPHRNSHNLEDGEQITNFLIC
ncbi:MAG: acylphosphatase [Actinobacteria bacterium]|nr:acylphosphatase [Actinomycetota bacterium]MCL6104160.1 acylphosphatase [Actinomycetota bacterium]